MTPGIVSTSILLIEAFCSSAKRRICVCANLISSMSRVETFCTAARTSDSFSWKFSGIYPSNFWLSFLTATSPWRSISCKISSTVARTFTSSSTRSDSGFDFFKNLIPIVSSVFWTWRLFLTTVICFPAFSIE